MLTYIRKLRLKNRELRILLLGLDGSGKSSICAKLLNGNLDEVSPTLGFEIKTVQRNGFRLNICKCLNSAENGADHAGDVGGQKTLRLYWRNYFEKTDTMIYVVDATDKERLEDCKDAFDELIEQEKLAGASLLIFNNKCDVEGAMSIDFVREVLELDKIPNGHTWTIMNSSAITGEGLEEGIEWVLKDGKKRYYLLDDVEDGPQDIDEASASTETDSRGAEDTLIQKLFREYEFEPENPLEDHQAANERGDQKQKWADIEEKMKPLWEADMKTWRKEYPLEY